MSHRPSPKVEGDDGLASPVQFQPTTPNPKRLISRPESCQQRTRAATSSGSTVLTAVPETPARRLFPLPSASHAQSAFTAGFSPTVSLRSRPGRHSRTRSDIATGQGRPASCFTTSSMPPDPFADATAPSTEPSRIPITRERISMLSQGRRSDAPQDPRQDATTPFQDLRSDVIRACEVLTDRFDSQKHTAAEDDQEQALSFEDRLVLEVLRSAKNLLDFRELIGGLGAR